MGADIQHRHPGAARGFEFQKEDHARHHRKIIAGRFVFGIVDKAHKVSTAQSLLVSKMSLKVLTGFEIFGGKLAGK